MTKCQWTEQCIFFTAEVGYSPELNQSMRERFCLTDNTGCARLEAMSLIALDDIPDDLIPTDTERLARLIEMLSADNDCE